MLSFSRERRLRQERAPRCLAAPYDWLRLAQRSARPLRWWVGTRMGLRRRLCRLMGACGRVVCRLVGSHDIAELWQATSRGVSVRPWCTRCHRDLGEEMRMLACREEVILYVPRRTAL